VSRTARRPRPLAVTAVFLAAGLVLSGCAAGQISQTADQVAAIDGANATVGDIGVRNARLATPADPAGYPAGADAPILLWLTNEGLDADTLSSVTSPAGTVTISGEATVQGGATAQFGADTAVKLSLKGTAALPYGKSIPMTFTFAKAGQLTTNVPIEIPVERTGERPTIEILPPHPTPLWETGAHGEEHAAEGSGAATTSAHG
jgi:periplasmic copper chaperone A